MTRPYNERHASGAVTGGQLEIIPEHIANRLSRRVKAAIWHAFNEVERMRYLGHSTEQKYRLVPLHKGEQVPGIALWGGSSSYRHLIAFEGEEGRHIIKSNDPNERKAFVDQAVMRIAKAMGAIEKEGLRMSKEEWGDEPRGIIADAVRKAYDRVGMDQTDNAKSSVGLLLGITEVKRPTKDITSLRIFCSAEWGTNGCYEQHFFPLWASIHRETSGWQMIPVGDPPTWDYLNEDARGRFIDRVMQEVGFDSQTETGYDTSVARATETSTEGG